MVATRHALVLLLVCGSALARHHTPELGSDASPDTHRDAAAPEQERRHRRKRWYTSYGYQQPAHQQQGFQYDSPPPPPGPVPYDPFAYIYRRIDELTALIRQPVQPPVVVPYPVYLPCSCAAGGAVAPGAPGPTPNVTTPNRFGAGGDDYDDIPIRPLDFNPVQPDRPLSRPPPPVEHGSSQAGAAPPVGAQPPSSVAFDGGFGGGASAAPAPTTNAPSRCEVATLTCCHQRYTTNQCFNTLGCPEALSRGNPCDARTISTVVSVFQNYYRNN